MPCLIFAVGRLVLGPYASGNLFALWRDFIAALAAGSRRHGSSLLGPYLLLWLLRAARALLHNRTVQKPSVNRRHSSDGTASRARHAHAMLIPQEAATAPQTLDEE